MIGTTNRHFDNIHKIYCQIAPYQAYLGIILLRLTLDIIVYVLIVNPVYGYSGFSLDFFAYKYVLSWIVTLMMTPFIANLYNNSSVSSTIVLLINLIYFIPGCTLYSLSGLPDSFFLFYVLYWILLMIWQYRIPYVHFKLPSERVSKRVFHFIIIIVAIGAIAIAGIYNGFQLNFHLGNIYELRAIRKEMELPTIARYFLPMATVLIPLTIMYFLSKKRYLLFFCMIFVQFLLFSFGGEKYALFMIPVAVMGYYFFREKRVNWFSWGIVVINVMALLEFVLNKSYIISAYIQYRALLVPNILSFQYFEFFTNNSSDWLFQGVLRRFGFISEYTTGIPNIIGLEYYDVAIQCNNGLIGDAFGNFAWLGILLFPLLIILSLRLMDACAYRIDRRILLTIFVGYAITLSNISFFGAMLTNGFLFMCIVLFFLPREGELSLGKR